MSTSTSPQRDHQVLRPEHQGALRIRAIPVDFAIEAGLRSVDLAAIKHLREKGAQLRWPNLPLHPVTGIEIPYQECLDGIPRCRVRSDKTEYIVPGPIDGSHHGEETVKVRLPGIAIVRFGAWRSPDSRHRDRSFRRIAIGAKRRLVWGLGWFRS